ncbi:hypothetical protein U6A24_14355 [Aquimarina gracilis]|uniref:Uncharacterized protein n=1 Tax=Aquimarina gracilis TaxID=874422 RepID=A0ABU5ZXV9_9FLAO|nr:hypothetical protein [Aquimarina gracilis]MEB3346657.1 hypothetical protein [Aquimarina gracilis]
MKIFLVFIFSLLSFLSFGQERTIQTISIELEQLTAPLSLVDTDVINNKYQLMEVDLSVDLRKQYLKKNTPLMLLPENKFIQQNYNVAIPGAPTNQRKVGFTISGNGYNSSLNRNTGDIKNNAYKDASLYSGAFCPITGLAY